jgi:hypothetical protein
VMPRIGSHFRIQDLQRVQEWVYVSSADESGGLWVASVWIIGDFTNFTHKNRDWFEAWNGGENSTKISFTQNLVLCGWGSEVLTPLFGGNLSIARRKFIVKQCEVLVKSNKAL